MILILHLKALNQVYTIFFILLIFFSIIFIIIYFFIIGSIPPLTVLDEKNGISVILHFAENSPRPDVSVIVITTISKNPSPLKDYLFQAVVPKVDYSTTHSCYLINFFVLITNSLFFLFRHASYDFNHHQEPLYPAILLFCHLQLLHKLCLLQTLIR